MDNEWGLNPIWTENKVREIINPRGNLLKSDEKIQRDAIMGEIDDNFGASTKDIRRVIASFLGWSNYDVAIALWAGQIELAEDLRSNEGGYEGSDDVEDALIERISQPACYYTGLTGRELGETVLPLIYSSAITQLRPDIWNDKSSSLNRVIEAIDEYVDEDFDPQEKNIRDHPAWSDR